MIERVLAHQEQGRGLGQAIGTEVRARIHRLLGGVEQQAAAQPLGAHDTHGVLRHALVGPEIELEALAQHGLVDVADAALPGRARIGDDDVDAAEGRRDRVERRAHRLRIGDVAGDAEALHLGDVAVEHRHFGALAREGGSGRRADAGGAAGDDHDAPRQRFLGRGAELRLFQRPVLDVEDVGFGNALVSAQPLGVGDHRHRRLGEVGRDLGILRRVADAEQADTRHQRHARDRIEFLLRRDLLAVVTHEVGVIVGRELFERGLGLALERVQLAGFRRGCDEGHVLGADRMVGRHRTLLAVARDLLAVHIGQDLGRTAELEHEALRGLAAANLRRQGEKAAQDRRDLRRRRGLRGQRGAREDLARGLGEALLGQGHEVDHADIGFLRRRAHREDAVLQQDQPVDVGVGAGDLGGLPGEREPRHDVGHQRRALAVEIGRQLGAVGLVGQRQHSVGMRMVDELVRQEGVQQRLDRRVGRLAVEQVGALHVHHVLVAQRLQPLQLAQRREADGGQAGRLDGAHVPAAALHTEHVERLAGDVGHARLHRRVAAAVQHQLRFAAQQAGRVDAQGEVLADSLGGVAGDGLPGVVVGPEVLHGAAYSPGSIPASLAIFTQVAISCSWYGLNCAGSRGSTVKPSLSIFSTTSGFFRLLTISPESLSSAGCGVAAGAKKAAHDEALAPVTPCSSSVATSGSCGLRLALPMAMARIVPALIWASTLGSVEFEMSMRPPTRSCTSGGAPR